MREIIDQEVSVMELEYVWDDRWDSIFHEIYQDGIESKRRGDLNRAVDIYFQNLEKYLRRDLLPIFPYAILLKALGKVLTLQGRYEPASTAYFFAADMYIYLNIPGEINSSLLHLGSCNRSFLATTKGVQYLASLKLEKGLAPGSPDFYMDLDLMRELIARGRKTYLAYQRFLYKGREMKEGRARDQEIRRVIGCWIERYRNQVLAPEVPGVRMGLE
jgi:hypothetical protein